MQGLPEADEAEVEPVGAHVRAAGAQPFDRGAEVVIERVRVGRGSERREEQRDRDERRRGPRLIVVQRSPGALNARAQLPRRSRAARSDDAAAIHPAAESARPTARSDWGTHRCAHSTPWTAEARRPVTAQNAANVVSGSLLPRARATRTAAAASARTIPSAISAGHGGGST